MERNLLLSGLAALLLLGLTSCGDDDAIVFTPRDSNGIDADVRPDERVPIGEVNPPEGEATFDLIAPRLPEGATAVPMHAVLSGPATDYTLTSVTLDENGTWEGTPVEAGTYTLIWLDGADGDETAFQEQVTVRENEPTFITLGAVWVHPESAAFAQASDTVALEYDIADADHTLKRVRADLNHVVHLPPGQWNWFGVGEEGGHLPALSLSFGEETLAHLWGSIYLESQVEARLFGKPGSVLLHSRMTPGVEYLLPVSPQAEGCYNYELVTGPEHLPTSRNIMLCSDGTRNFAH